jgi:hypothetical protein
MATRLGITTVTIDGQNKNINELNPLELQSEWIKIKHEINDLYSVNEKANNGWRGVILKLIDVHLPDRKYIKLGGINSKGESIVSESN